MTMFICIFATVALKFTTIWNEERYMMHEIYAMIWVFIIGFAFLIGYGIYEYFDDKRHNEEVGTECSPIE